jgi:hypothetical protein
MVTKLKAIKAELRRRKHHRTTEVGVWLRKVVLGYYQYHAVPGNTGPLRVFMYRVRWLWRSVLVRPSESTRRSAMGSSPSSRKPLDSHTPRSAPLSRCALCRHASTVRAVCINALVRICAGGVE